VVGKPAAGGALEAERKETRGGKLKRYRVKRQAVLKALREYFGYQRGSPFSPLIGDLYIFSVFGIIL
jgi:hypothetical protein